MTLKKTGQGATGAAKRVRHPATLLKQLFTQFQKQLDEFEQCKPGKGSLERDARSLSALAATLERLTALGENMKKKKQEKRHATTKGLDRGSLLRELCERLEKLAKAEESPGKNSGSRKRAE